MSSHSKKNCLIIAGERSGEDHCLSFFAQLKCLLPDCHFWGVGGDRMKEMGQEQLYHLKDFSTWGFSGVFKKIPFYKKALENIENECVKRSTKVAILIDYQGFNLRLAKRLKKIGVEVLYYVAPQAWAWKSGRTKKLEKTVHTLFTIIPFEKEWFESRGVTRVKSILHPLVETYKDQLKDISTRRSLKLSSPTKILLLPGSRQFEVESLLPEFVKTIDLLKKQFNISVGLVQSSSVKEVTYLKAEKIDELKVFNEEDLAQALKWADLAMAASGTVTLTCALFGLPTVVTYIVSNLNYYIYESFIPYDGPVSLANIVHQENVFPELIQNKVSAFNIAREIEHWIKADEERKDLVKKLVETKNVLAHDCIDVPKYMEQIITEKYGQ